MITDILGVIAVLMVAAGCLLGGWLLARIRHPCNCKTCWAERGDVYLLGYEEGKVQMQEACRKMLDRASPGKPAASPHYLAGSKPLVDPERWGP